MECPNCQGSLRRTLYLDLVVDQCENCHGLWLDHEELDALEDQAFAEDDLKGSLMITSEVGQRLCPHCRTRLREFQYRLTSLHLDFCEQGHGFWLDAAEAERVLDVMTARAAAMERKLSVEADWRQTLRRFRSGSFWGGGPGSVA
jgi:Zn-finger nucleic acid-binding protein